MQRKTLAPSVVLGKKLEFYSQVSSFSNLNPICESQIFWVRILQHRSVIIFWYFCAEQMALVALKELRHSQYLHCWVLSINNKDQNATFNGVLMAVCVLKPTCLCSSAPELEQSGSIHTQSVAQQLPAAGSARNVYIPHWRRTQHIPWAGHYAVPEHQNNHSEGRESLSRGLQPPQRLWEPSRSDLWQGTRLWLHGAAGAGDVAELPGDDRAHECNYFL